MEDLLKEYELSLYEDIKTISEGKVYLVSNSKSQQIYIKKILKKECLDVYKRLKGLKNKNRAEIIDYFIIGENLIVIEEFVHGKTLEKILEENYIDEDYAIDICISICDGLYDLHRMDKPLIHRDIKPSNVMISSDGIVKLIDFDVSRVLKDECDHDTVILGTKEYASPEQFGFAQTDGRSDIYSIGVLLNFILVKDFPKNKIAEGKLREVILKATQIDRLNRYQNLDQFKDALNKAKTQEQIKFFKDKKIIDNKKIKNINIEKINKFIHIKPKWFFKYIVGYRSGNIIFMLLASLWYFTAFFGYSQFFYTKLLSDLILATYMIILPEFIIGSGFTLNKYIPLVNSEILYKKVIGRVIYFIVVTLISGILMQ
ncbi:serine/threonine-protein kinase [Clostridium thermobutyricum]